MCASPRKMLQEKYGYVGGDLDTFIVIVCCTAVVTVTLLVMMSSQ